MSSQPDKKRVLILCTGNSCRSQMAEGLLRTVAGQVFEVSSAGTSPTSVNPMAVRVMAELTIDIAGQRSKAVSEFADREFDFVITVCDRARDACPVFPVDAKQLHWSFEDPADATGTEGERLRVFRRVRDAIAERLHSFVSTEST